MCYFLAPSGQAGMRRENFMRMALLVFVLYCLRMRFHANARLSPVSPLFVPERGGYQISRAGK